ncbi:MAG: 2-hydroxychromene-2-carboxylate isomerase [Labilithrix sp.]|nr:2-hydroxychromene-2-carboxylate isomerase [Labilithrix sp.]MCW5812032.1 2-hydroxychromene-2-carboxylate isomerase [Labilithrix sp.]
MNAIEEARTLPARSLDFWFDYTCPYAYLGSTRAQAVADRMGVKLTWQPLLLGGVLKANGQPQNLFATRSAARVAYDAEDMKRWAKRLGVELSMPAGHPLRSVEALRATIATNVDPAVVAAFYRAYWIEGRAISSPDVIADVVTKAGYDAEAILAAIATDSIKDDLRARTDRAIALGVFGVPAWIVDGEHLYWGQDRIEQVEGVRRASTPAADAPKTGKVLEVFWDFSSPFAYLGTTQVDALAKRTGATVVWHPMLLGGLFKSLGGPDVPIATFSEAKQRWLLSDLERWARVWGVPYKWPSRFPTNSLKALRLYFALPAEHRDRYRAATFRAMWADDEDITDDAVLARCVGDERVAKAAFATIGDDEVKAALRESTNEAHARGVFGAPTFIVGDDLYWGQDRLDLVEDALVETRSDDRALRA